MTGKPISPRHDVEALIKAITAKLRAKAIVLDDAESHFSLEVYRKRRGLRRETEDNGLESSTPLGPAKRPRHSWDRERATPDAEGDSDAPFSTSTSSEFAARHPQWCEIPGFE